MSCIRRALKSAAPKLKRQFCGSASNTKADSKGKGLWETTIRRIAWVYTPVAVVVSDGLRSTLTWSKFQNFPGGACSQTPLQDCACSIYIASFSGFWATLLRATYCKRRIREGRGMRLARHTNPHSVCMPPPFFNLWIHSCPRNAFGRFSNNWKVWQLCTCLKKCECSGSLRNSLTYNTQLWACDWVVLCTSFEW